MQHEAILHRPASILIKSLTLCSVNFLSLDSYHANLKLDKFYPSARRCSLPDAKSKQYIAGSGLSEKQ